MTIFQWIALAILVLFFLLTLWGFAKASEDRVKILGLVASLAGVAVGYLLQEARVQDKQAVAVEARADANHARAQADSTRSDAIAAVEFAVDAERRLTDMQQLLQSSRRIEGNLVAIPMPQAREMERIIRERPEFRLRSPDRLAPDG